MTRDESQDYAAECWRKAKGQGIVIAPPRYGKTRVGLKVIKRYTDKNPDDKPIVCVPNELIRQRWLNENNDTFNVNFEIYTISEFVLNQYKMKTGLFIIDEFQKFLTEQRQRIFGTLVEYKYFLGLTGNDTPLVKEHFPVVFKLTEREAIDAGYISPSVEYNYGVELSDDEKKIYADYTNHMKDKFINYKDSRNILSVYLGGRISVYSFESIFPTDYSLMQSCYSGKNLGNSKRVSGDMLRQALAEAKGWHQGMNLQIPEEKFIEENYNPAVLFEMSKTFNEIVRKRNEIINTAQAKIDAVKEIVAKHPYSKVIVFSQSIKFADNLNNQLNDDSPNCSVVYHSKIESRPDVDLKTGLYYRVKSTGNVKIFGLKHWKDKAMNAIIDGTSRVLCTVASLNEGLDIPDLEIAIVASGDCNPIVDYQRKSRVKTLDEDNPNKLAKIINIYIDDFVTVGGDYINSRDLIKLRERQLGNPIWVNNLNEII